MSKSHNVYYYKAIVDRIVDADTFDVVIDLGFSLTHKIRIRILDYDAPESYRPKSEQEKILAYRAVEFATKLLKNKDIIIETQCERGYYQRYLANILIDGVEYKDIMIENKFIKSEIEHVILDLED